MNNLTLKKQIMLGKKEKMDNEIMLGLRKTAGINVKIFYQKFGEKIHLVYPINSLLNNKCLIYRNGFLKIHPDKIYLMNEVLLKILF